VKPTVYLAGPITNKTISEANDWRVPVCAALEEHGIVGVSPLRCEPPRGERYTIANADPLFGTSRAIRSKNILDVKFCSMTLAYLPKHLNPSWPSVGTIGELCMASAFGKPTILVSDDPRLTEHPVLRACAGWILPTLEDATEVMVGVLKVYG
jgi:nucleoside 2-deoxyribosyltransferase